ncbi:hypothetical protein DVA67_032145 [Solirubrobacter sp. CPCC 204708]|nr:hypothetical protein [Solirubrobacter deserti]
MDGDRADLQRRLDGGLGRRLLLRRGGAGTAPRQRERDQDEGVSSQGVVVDSVNVNDFE